MPPPAAKRTGDEEQGVSGKKGRDDQASLAKNNDEEATGTPSTVLLKQLLQEASR